MKSILPKGVEFISIIICTYNRSEDLKQTLSVLCSQVQSYDFVEIIVVDDKSEDDTASIASDFPVNYIKNSDKQGIAWVRNLGFTASQGDIVIYLDDDCHVSENWLEHLLKPFNDSSVMGTGGLITAQNNKNLISLFMLETGYGNPSKQAKVKEWLPDYAKALLSYFIESCNPIADHKEQIIITNLIFGANCAFRREQLLGVDGYDNKYKTSEDTNLCHRLKKKYPHMDFHFVLKAAVAHKHYTSFRQLLGIQFKRAANSVTLRRENSDKWLRMTFMYPCFMILLTLALFFVPLNIGIPAFLSAPLFCYFWWPLRAFKRKRLYPIILPYIQLASEATEFFSVIYTSLRRK